MTPHVYRLPLSVEVRFTTDGRMLPLRVQYSEETYEIDRVLAVRRYRPPGVACIAPVEYTVLLLPMVLVWYILTELGSILENAAAMGTPVPEFLIRILASAKEKVEVATGEDSE